MNWTTTLPFILDGVDGDLKLVYTPMGQKLYQNGREIKRSGFGLAEQKYRVETTDGGYNVLSIKGNLKNGRQVAFRSERINLETPVGVGGILLSLLPFVFIAAVVFLLSAIAGGGFHLSVIDVGLLAGCGAVGMQAIVNYARNEKDFIKLLTYSVIASVAATLLFVALSLVISLIFGAIFGTAFALLA